MSPGVRDANFYAKGASPAGAMWGYLDAQCYCTLQKEFTSKKVLPALVQRGTCDSGIGFVSPFLLSITPVM